MIRASRVGETQASSVIIQMIENKKIELITSTVISYENRLNGKLKTTPQKARPARKNQGGEVL